MQATETRFDDIDLREEPAGMSEHPPVDNTLWTQCGCWPPSNTCCPGSIGH